MSVSGKQKARFLLAILVLGLGLTALLPANQVSAAQITHRSLTLQDGATDGGSKPGGTVKHLFTVTLPSTATIHSIKFQYCTTADGACVKPSGLTTTSVTLGTQTTYTFDSVNNTTDGAPYLTSAAGISPDGTSSASFQLISVVNPDGTDCPAGNQGSCTFFARITTYTSANATTGSTDSGVVAASTTQAIVLTGTMPESLIFCTGATISTTSGRPDCSTAGSGSVSFNADFSPSATAYATSQMAASTNATYGYAITVSGPTMTSGSNTIAPIGTSATASALSTSQFGMNLVHNTTTPAIPASADIAPASDGTNYFGAPTTNFSTDGSFAFAANTLNTIAKSDNGTGTAGPSDVQIYTASYIVNVRGNQPAGTYTSTLTYICTPTF